jgi:hypothetical protein
MKTGLLTLLTVSVVGGHFLLQFVLPVEKEDLHLIKDLLSNLLLFVFVPMGIIFRNKNMLKFVAQTVSDTDIYKGFNSLGNFVTKCTALCRKRNQVAPRPEKVQLNIEP